MIIKHLVFLLGSLALVFTTAKAQTVDIGLTAGQSFGIDLNYFNTQSEHFFNFFGGYILHNGLSTEGDKYTTIGFREFPEDIVEVGTRSVIGGLRAGHIIENSIIHKAALYFDLALNQDYEVQNRFDRSARLGNEEGRYYIEQKAGMDLGIGMGLKRLTKLKKVTLSYGAFVNSATGINLTLGIKLF